MKLKGTALPIVMIFSILIGSMLSVELLKTELTIKEIDNIRERKELNDLIRLRQQQVMRENIIEAGIKQLPDKKQVYTEIRRWGMLDLVNLIARSEKASERSCFILSYLHDTSFISINSQEKNIELSDSAVITGYEAKSRKLHNIYSNRTKACYELSKQEQVEMWKPGLPSFPKAEPDASAINLKKDSIQRSFYEEPLVIHSQGDIHLADIQIYGHIYIRSEQTIILDSSANLDGAILSGRHIRISGGTKLCGQLFADESLLIGGDVELSYPSVICLNSGTKSKGEDQKKKINIPFIRFEKRSQISGSVIHFRKSSYEISPILFIEPGSKVLGEVHFEGTAHVQGGIFGSATIDELASELNGNIESGRMKHGQIRGFREASGFSLLRKNNKRFIAKYLS